MPGRAGKARLYARAKRSNLIAISLTESVTPCLRAMGLTLKSPEITREVQRGAQMMAAAAQRRVPVVKTGGLKRGIYTVSLLKDNRPVISRRRTTNIVQELRRPPVRGQVLVVSGTFYGLWVEKGRAARVKDAGRAKAHERRAVGLQGGRKRGRPFFKKAIREARPSAELFVARRIERLLVEAFEKGR